MINPRVGAQAEAVNGGLYVIGGTAGGCPQPPALASEVYVPDLWSSRAPLTSAAGGQRTEFGTAVVDGRIYAFGGGNCLIFFNDVQAYDPIGNSWSARNSMPSSRAYGVAAAVNGKIYLMGGGITPHGPYAPTLEYDPVTDSWTPKAAMPTARLRSGVAVIDNKIYVVGGMTQSAVPLSTVEAYDPATDSWTSLEPMSIARVKPAVGSINGLLYAFGGSDSSFAIVASGEMYDPGLDMWFDAPPLPAARTAAGAATFDGSLYVVGGQTAAPGNPLTGTTYAFRPSGSGSWTFTGSLAVKRFYFPGAIALPDGRVLVAGGFNYQQGTLASAELYSPATGTWSATGNMGTARRGHAAVVLPTGKVLVAGGLTSSAELYDPATGTWSETGSMSAWRYVPTATLLANGKVLVVGGYDPSFTPRTSAELYDPGTGTWSLTSDMESGRVLHCATLLRNGQVLVTGGWNGGPRSSAELYDPATGTWSAAASMTTRRDSHAALLLPDGTVLVAGGETDGGIGLASAEIYNPDTGAWSATDSMSSPRAAATATLIPGSRVLVAGGLSRNAVGAELATAELYDLATGTWSATGSMGNARYVHGTVLLRSGKVLVAAGNGLNDSPLATAELYEPPAPSAPPPPPQVTPVITWPTPADITYDAPLSSAELNATTTVPGSFAYSPQVGTVLSAGAGQTLNTTFIPNDTDHYTTATKSVTINVLKATPVITWANPADIIYGAALSDAQLNATADVAGTFAYSPPAGTVLSAGSGQTLAVTFTPADTANYATVTKTVMINVLTPAQATQQLSATVNSLVSSGVLTPTEAGALSAKLDTAAQKLTNGNQTAASGQLGAFINQVNALLKSNKLSQIDGAALIDAANAVIANIGG